MTRRTINDYQDIIHLPHFTSRNHPRMSMEARAAQFSPFAALTGYDAAAKETARLTGRRLELDEDEKQKISDRLNQIVAHLAQSPSVEITYFVPDKRKAGGEYHTVTGSVKKLDAFQRILTLSDGQKIPIDEIAHIDITIIDEANIDMTTIDGTDIGEAGADDGVMFREADND